MAPRLELQTLLEEILGTNNVYFQPPTNVNIQYPCIVYKRDSADTTFADNNPYQNQLRYQIIVIDRDPDGEVLEKISSLPLCRYDRFYITENLNHDVFELYF